MSSFFDLPPAPDDPEPHKRHRQPAWQGPLPATVPAVLPVEGVIARTEDVAVAITPLRVFPEGLEIDVVSFSRPREEDTLDDRFDPMLMHYPHVSSELTDKVLRIGVQFADGRKATNLGEHHGFPRPSRGELVFRSGGGGGGGDRWAQTYWLWPIPDEGPLSIVCEWPAHGIPVSRLDVDGDAIRAAAARATVVFSDEHLPEEPPDDPEDGGWARYVRVD